MGSLSNAIKSGKVVKYGSSPKSTNTNNVTAKFQTANASTSLKIPSVNKTEANKLG